MGNEVTPGRRERGWRALFVGALAGLSVLFFAALAGALAAGDFDPSFATGGKFVNPLGEGARPGARVHAIALQPDGKIVVTGAASQSKTVVARINTDGTLDASFGVGGRLLTDLGAAANDSPSSRSLVVQADGKVVIGGSMGNFGTQENRFLLARVQADGSGLDPSFGTGGRILMQLGQGTNPFSSVGGLALQPDGKILAAGGARDSSSKAAVLIARLNPDGSFDSSFGDAGKITPQFGLGVNAGSGASEIVLLPDGKVLIAGAATDTNNAQADAIFFARVNADGRSFDPTFDNDGAIVTRLGQSSPVITTLEALALQPDGKIVVGGGAIDAQSRHLSLLARLNSDGSLDGTFGVGGTLITQLGTGGNPSSQINAVVIQPDGKIVAAGSATGSNGASEILVVRLNADGTFDSSFAAGGKLATQLAPLFSYLGAAVLQPDGKLVAGGAVVDNTPDEHALVIRLVVNLPPSASFTAAPNPVEAGQPVTFGDSGSSDPDGAIVSHAWDFGDGATAAGAGATHSYAGPGTYTATLTVRDIYGLTATSSQAITVNPVAVTPQPPRPDPAPPPIDPPNTAAVLSRLRIDPAAFRAARRGGSIARDSRVLASTGRGLGRVTRIGAFVSYRISRAATTTFAVSRATPGRRTGRHCVKGTERNRDAARCTRLVRVRGSFVHRGRAGANRFRFTGRVRGRALAPGRYRLYATPRADGRNGRTVPARFRIIR